MSTPAQDQHRSNLARLEYGKNAHRRPGTSRMTAEKAAQARLLEQIRDEQARLKTEAAERRASRT